MVAENIKKQLIKLAEEYETPEFILSDPVQFPRRYIDKRDIEIVGFISSWCAYGNRTQFIPLLDGLFEAMKTFSQSPYEFIINRRWIPMQRFYGVDTTLYRFYKYQDFYNLCASLREVYVIYGSLENSVASRFINSNSATDYLVALIKSFQIPVEGVPKDTRSACKRLNMFLRWMARQNSPVDLGIWKSIPNEHLLIPLDTHVAKISRQIGLITAKRDNMDTVLKLTAACREVFPNDPCRCDFALFGYGVNNKSKTKEK